jgi:hypothetical protein
MASEKTGSIYQAKSKSSGKVYVGQTQSFKVKNAAPYRYGVMGRWSDHVSSAMRGATAPLAEAIRTLGADDFEVTPLETDVAHERLDEREAYWIATLNTVAPNGYNVMRHARCKHRTDSTLSQAYLPTTHLVRVCVIRRHGAPRLVYVYLEQTDESVVRLVFGQAADSTFERAMEEAQEFATVFVEAGIEVAEEEEEDPLRKYRVALSAFCGNPVSRVRIAPFNHLVALHITTAEGTKRMCFGGKTISLENAYKTAVAVVSALGELTTITFVQDDISRSATGGCSSR